MADYQTLREFEDRLDSIEENILKIEELLSRKFKEEYPDAEEDTEEVLD